LKFRLFDSGNVARAQSALCVPVFDNHDVLEVSGKSGATPPLPSQL